MAESLQMQIKRLERKLKDYSEKAVPRAALVAINKTAKPIASQVAKAVGGQQKIPAKLVKQRIIFNKATFNRKSAYIKSFARGINVARLLTPAKLNKFMGTGNTKTGVAVAGGEIKGGFINTVRKNGRVFVFTRQGRARYHLDVQRIPIDEALLEFQLPISQARFEESFLKFYAHELAFRISKYTGN